MWIGHKILLMSGSLKQIQPHASILGVELRNRGLDLIEYKR